MIVSIELEGILRRIDCIRDCDLNRTSAQYEECPKLRERARRELQDLRILQYELERKVRKMYGEQ